MTIYRSMHARQVGDLDIDPKRPREPWGLCVHMTGRSIVQRARARGEDALAHAAEYYRSAEHSCHYLVGHDGTILQISDEDRRVPHVGIEGWQRESYLSAGWHAKVKPKARLRWLDHWREHFGMKSPQHIYPSTSANDDYIGVELLPALSPSSLGLWHTSQQHEAVAALADDMRRRHRWPVWKRYQDEGEAILLPQPRLLGHEDIDAFDRWDAEGGWDPGALRPRPRFSWMAVAVELEKLSRR